MTDTSTAHDSAPLPVPVVTYLDARDDHRPADAAAAFAPNATVIDDGKTYQGIEAITAWIHSSSTEYTYSSTRIGHEVTDGNHADVQVRLDGDFPGGTVVLRYRFDLDAGRIGRLTIEV
ncbi:nuclear transport factor 2 family protein [Nakamurella sp.]|uniref:nuclear transport factor 2 family protein n=1 Tax=Nakamurella sp. TaxID=1869182 RepID=UPI003B3AE4C9